MLPVTIAENVAGAEIDNIDMDRVHDCLKKAGLYDKVMSLPEKENTRLVKSVLRMQRSFPADRPKSWRWQGHCIRAVLFYSLTSRQLRLTLLPNSKCI